MLSSIFTQLLKNYTSDEGLTKQLWSEIEKHYTSNGRYYHTLLHLQNMYTQLLAIKEKIKDWDTLLFSLFYHDVIYSIIAKDNEEKSAALVEKRLAQINYPQQKVQLCVQQILATKSHLFSTDNDTNYFTDADLTILGTDWPEYEQYTKAIRREYSIYPDLIYKPGRRKVLQHFLAMQQIYKTECFQQMFEARARENMQEELRLLHK